MKTKPLLLITCCVIWLSLHARGCVATLPEGVSSSAGAGSPSHQATGSVSEAHEQHGSAAQSSEWQSFMVAAAQGFPRWHPTLALLWAQQHALYYSNLVASRFRAAYGTVPPPSVLSNLTASLAGSIAQATAGVAGPMPIQPARWKSCSNPNGWVLS